MKNLFKMLAVVMAAVTVAAAPCASGQESAEMAEPAQEEVEQPKVVEMTGKITAVKDDLGLLTAATLAVGEGDQAESVAIKLDLIGRKMVRGVPADKAVKVTGTVSETDGQKTVTVHKFEIVKEDTEAAEEAPAEEPAM